jgi:amino acid transporter
MVLIYSPPVSCRNSTVTYCGSTTRTPRRGNGQIFTTAISSTTWARYSAVISSHRWCSYRALPQRFARVHRRYQTPWFGTLVVGVSGCTIYLVMALVSQNSLADMVESLALATVFSYTVTANAHGRTYRRTLLGRTRLLAPGCPSVCLVGGGGSFWSARPRRSGRGGSRGRPCVAWMLADNHQLQLAVNDFGGQL